MNRISIPHSASLGRDLPHAEYIKRKQRERAVPLARQEQFPGRRTKSQRALARKGVSLRAAVLLPRTVQAYQTAFAKMWNWIGRSPPISVHSTRTYDALLATYIEEAWVSGETRGDAGNALSASLSAYPELRGRGVLSESWYLFNAWAKLEVPMRAPPMPPLVTLALAA